MNNIKAKIKKADPVLILYPAGLGGEHIAHTLTTCNDDFEKTAMLYNEKVNQFHTVCVFKYSSEISDINDVSTAIDIQYKGEFPNTSKRIVLKDHTTELSFEFYKKHFPNITILCLIAEDTDSINYFAELTFKKLAKKITSPIDEWYVKNEISQDCTPEEAVHVINQVNKFRWVWRHEAHILINHMRSRNSQIDLEHSNDLTKSISNHKHDIINTNRKIDSYKDFFTNFHFISVDDLALTDDSETVWREINKHVGSIDVVKAKQLTNEWIRKNNKLSLL